MFKVLEAFRNGFHSVVECVPTKRKLYTCIFNENSLEIMDARCAMHLTREGFDLICFVL